MLIDRIPAPGTIDPGESPQNSIHPKQIKMGNEIYHSP